MPKQEDLDIQPEVMRRLKRWLILSIDPLLLITHLTVIYLVALIADELLLQAISISFRDLIQQSTFASRLLLGLKLFSAVGVALAYAFHTIYQLYLQATHLVKVLKDKSELSPWEER